MFAGITRGVHPVVRLERGAQVLSYEVELPRPLLEGLEVGASVAIDGVCQTVVAVGAHTARFDAIQATLDRTTLDELCVGRRVSVERSCRVGDEVGGHEVSGHVSGVGTTIESVWRGDELGLRIQVPASWMRCVFDGGFIAVDGSSLTVREPEPGGTFGVALIPETCRVTNFARHGVGARVNVELDARTVAIVATVERVLAARPAQRAPESGRTR